MNSERPTPILESGYSWTHDRTLYICETSVQVHFFSPPANYSKLFLQLENHLSMKIKCSKSSEMWPRGKSKRPQR